MVVCVCVALDSNEHKFVDNTTVFNGCVVMQYLL